MTTQRILIVGWDGGTWRVFGPLVERGLMPNLKSLMDRGSFGTMTSTIPPVTPPAWTTLLTGLKPEKHGIFGFMEGMVCADSRQEFRSRSRPVSALSLKHRSLLDILGDAGKHVMCINVPMTYPPRPVHGIMISDFLSPSDAVDFTYPAELKDELEDYVIDIIHATRIQETTQQRLGYAEDAWVKRCTQIVRIRADNICRLGKTHPWDFGIVVFTATDRIFHPRWPEIVTFLDKEAPTTEMERLLLEFFVELDRALGRLVESFGDATVLLTSDHGFQQRADHAVHVDVWLEREGFLVRKRRGSGRKLRRALRSVLRAAMEKLLPPRLTARLLLKATDRQTRMAESIDRERSVAYFAGFDAATYGAVRLVAETTTALDEKQRSELLRNLIDSLKNMTDPETDEPIIKEAFLREELFPGAVVDFLPEIVLEFREGYTGRVDPLATGLLGPSPKDNQIGVHQLDGMFVLAGEAVKPLGEVAPLQLADIAPTVLYLSGLPIPNVMQGSPPLQLLADEYVATHPVEHRDYAEEPHRPPGERAAAYTQEQERQVKDHLRRLGYLE